MTDGEQLARQFHTLYEAMAPKRGFDVDIWIDDSPESVVNEL